MKPSSGEDVRLSVLWEGFGQYNLNLFKSDLLAAVNVALLSVPLSMAYALAAGLPVSVGILASIFGTFFASAFGSSKQLIVGPSNTIAILIQAGIASILYTNFRSVSPEVRNLIALQLLALITFVAGLFQFFAGIFKLGRLTQFVSRSVIVGYIVGAATAIIFNQLFYFFGVTPPEQPQAVFDKLLDFSTHLTSVHLPTMTIALFAFLFFFALERMWKKLPAAALMLLAAGLAVIALDLSPADELRKVLLLKDFGETPKLAIKFAMPMWNLAMLNAVLPISFAVALLGILEATAIARQLATTSGQHFSTNQEIFALGSANLVSACFGGMPGSGSFTRSSLNFAGGAKTRAAAALSALCVIILVVLFFPVVVRIPLGALAALLIITAWRMIKWNEVLFCLRATAADAFVLVATAISCIFFNVDMAFYIGIILSILLYLKKAASPRFIECHLDDTGQLKSLTPQEIAEKRPIRILQVDGELFFAAADLLQVAVKALARDPEVKVIILKLTNAFHLDATAASALQHLLRYTRSKGCHLLLSGITRPVWQVLSDSGFTREIGAANLFLMNPMTPAACIQAAYFHAENMIGITPVPSVN